MTTTAPTREFLVWLARGPRTYGEAMDAWASHCPRYTIWEDALAADLVQVTCCPGQPLDQAEVRLTSKGQIALHLA